jgi:4-hydroxybenzoyl-CoA thioesterase
MSEPYVSQSRVRFSQTDPASFVFFPRYFEMIQAAVEDWFTESLGIDYARMINIERLGLPTAKTQCEFWQPTRLGEAVDMAVYLTRIGNSSIDVTFAGAVKGEQRLRAHSVLVFISLDDGRPRPITPEMRVQLDAYMHRQGDIPPQPDSSVR